MIRSCVTDDGAIDLWRNVDGEPDRRHLELHGYKAHLLHHTRATDAAITHEGHGLIVPLAKYPIDRVLKHRRITVVVFRHHHYVRIGLAHLLCPLADNRVRIGSLPSSG